MDPLHAFAMGEMNRGKVPMVFDWEKAARLIKEEGALDGRDGVEALAARVGVGGRHLTRLFRRHLGASPIEVAKTARVQRAKRLITDTDLPMTDVALQAGFGSLRRFNAVFREVYRRPPSEMRRGRGTKPAQTSQIG